MSGPIVIRYSTFDIRHPSSDCDRNNRHGMRKRFPAAVSTRQMPWACEMGDLATEINSRYGPLMPCGLRLGASVVLHYGVRGIEERPLPRARPLLAGRPPRCPARGAARGPVAAGTGGVPLGVPGRNVPHFTWMTLMHLGVYVPKKNNSELIPELRKVNIQKEGQWISKFRHLVQRKSQKKLQK